MNVDLVAIIGVLAYCGLIVGVAIVAALRETKRLEEEKKRVK